MKKIRSFFAVACTALLSLPFVACDEPEPLPEPEPEPVIPVVTPAVTVTAGEVTATTLSFTVTPENAEKCAWICLDAGQEIPAAEQILSNEKNAVSATETATVEVSDLAPETEYVIVAAASNGETAVVSEKITMKTLEKSAIQFQGAIAEAGLGESIVLFYEDSGTYQLALYFHYNSDETLLPEGTYTIGGNGGTAGTVDGDALFTQFRLLKENKTLAISEGTVTVAIDENSCYNIAAEFTTEEGAFKTAFIGDIDGFNLAFKFTATSAKYFDEADKVPGEFCIRLNDANWGYELVLDLFADAGAATLPEGTYTVGTGTNPGTMGSKSYIDIFSPYNRHVSFATGTVEVKLTNFVYTFNIKLEDADGFKINGKFSGQITEIEYTEGEIVLENAISFSSGSYGSTRESSLRFFRGDDQLQLAVIYDINSKYLPAGTYTVRDSEEVGTITNANSDYTYFYYKEDLLSIISGTMTVDVNPETEVYDIFIECRTTNGDFKLSYKGKIDGFKFGFDLSDLSSAIRVKPDGEIPGEYCIKLEDVPNKTFEVTLDFFADPASKTLPEGTYTVGTGTTPGTIGSNSFLNIKYPANTIDTFATGTVVVTKKDDVYTFDINLANANGYKMAGTFTGKIVGMEREEDTDRKVIECTYIKQGADCDQSQRHAYWYMGNTLGDSVDIDYYNDGSSILPAGTYTVGEGTSAGTIVGSSDFTYLRTKVYDPKGVSQKFRITEGTMTVEIDGDTYKITFDFTADNGDKFRVKYEGPVGFTW